MWKIPCYLKLKYTREIRSDNASIQSSPSEKLLGITLDSELKFEVHNNKICNIVCTKNLNLPKFDELLEDGSFSIHQRNIQTLAIEIFEFLNGLSPLNKVFQITLLTPSILSVG